MQSIDKLARWIAALPAKQREVVIALQLANEPVSIYFGQLVAFYIKPCSNVVCPWCSSFVPTRQAMNTYGHDASVKKFFTESIAAARSSLPSLPLVTSFMPPNDQNVPDCKITPPLPLPAPFQIPP